MESLEALLLLHKAPLERFIRYKVPPDAADDVWQEVCLAARLGIPVGTVKSRLHTARQNFREKYPYPPKSKGENTMKALPEFLPEYTITKSDAPPFALRHEELPGMFIVPRPGQSCIHGSYDFPQKKLTHTTELHVTGKIRLHGEEGVEIDQIDREGDTVETCAIFAQLTEDFCRYLGGMHLSDGVRYVTTFLDEDFGERYGIGENNTGFAVHRLPQGKITEDGDGLHYAASPDLSDICGRYTVTIGCKSWDTVRLVDVEAYKGIMLCEYYIDQTGRTVLWRRFNSDDWAYERYGKRWSELLPENERLTVNGETFVHWYDCITDYIL